MNRYVAVLVVCLVAAGCSKRNDSEARSERAGSGVGAQADTGPPMEDMASIPAGTYPLSDPVFAPDRIGTCSPETLAKVKALGKHTTWPDQPQDIPAFAIDKRPVSCADYQRCVARKGCWEEYQHRCDGGRVTVDQAIAYCLWRGAKLPTLQQWQAAVRGPTGKVSAPCDAHTIGEDDCTITNDAGVTTSAGWGTSEFTRTMACWPTEEDERTGLRAIMVTPSKLQLNMLLPFAPQNPRPGHRRAGFRCARDEAGAANP